MSDEVVVLGEGRAPSRDVCLPSARVSLYVLFGLSGACGLFYEALWARYLGLFVGHTAYAQLLVLAIFLGGMALGALAIGARTERIREPLQWYAWAEAAIGVLGLLFHPIYSGVTHFSYDVLFPWLGGGWLVDFSKWAFAGLMVLPASVLLGTTFPLMSAGVLRRFPASSGRTLSLLYFSNSLGAALGVLVAGFALVPRMGLPGTLLVAGLLNLLVAALTAVLGLWLGAQKLDAAQPPAQAAARTGAPTAVLVSRQLLGAVAFGTAVASFIYEIGWIRMLSLVLGSASHSFELMLSAFILGLALGSLWVRARLDVWRAPQRALGLVQWAMGLAALATLPLYAKSFDWMGVLINTLARTDEGYVAFSLARYGLCLAIMLPATFCAGITLPLITRLLITAGEGERAIGRVYGLNTLGSILGAVIAGLVLLPMLGTRGMLVLGGALDMALGVAVLHAVGRDRTERRVTAAAGLGAAAVALLCLWGVDIDARVLASGPFRSGMPKDLQSRAIEFYEDGRTATVSAVRLANGGRLIATNGKTDGSLQPVWFEPCGKERVPLASDSATQSLSPLISLAHRPDAKRVAIVGFGSGMSTHFVLTHPGVERVETIEIEPAMVRGARSFYPANRLAYDDPRSQVVYADARTHFASSGARYDLVISEPSNPWVSGVASLFTREWYEHVQRYLSDGGVFAQWMQLYENNDDLMLSVLAAVHRSFPAYEIFLTADGDVLIVASKQIELRKPDWSVFQQPEVVRSFCNHRPISAGMLEAMRLTHRSALGPLLDGWQNVNSDFFPVLEGGAERARFMKTVASGVLNLHNDSFDIAAPFFRREAPLTVDGPPAVLGIRRMERMALADGWLKASATEPLQGSAEPELARSLFELTLWRSALASDRPPADWKGWLGQMKRMSEELSSGPRSEAAREFFGEVRRYLAAVQAPPQVLQVVEFREALVAWEFERVAHSGRQLLPGVMKSEGWMRASELLDGMVVALLQLGDPAAAQEVYGALTRFAQPEQLEQLRYRLLRSYLDEVQRSQAGRSAALRPR